MSELTPEDLDKVKWIGEKSLSIANHQSGMRLTITALNFSDEYNKVSDHYHCLYERNCFWPFCWVTKSQHDTFWPLVNFLMPALPAILLLYLKWSIN